MNPDDMTLLDGMATMRSIRRYTDEAIPIEDLSTIMWHATRAPSGSNRQPFRFLVLRDGPKAMQARTLLGDAFRRGWAEKSKDDGYSSGSGTDLNSPKARMAASMQHYVDNFESVPVLILAFLNRFREPTIIEGASVYPACHNLLLAARALGYGGVLTGWHMLVQDELRELFNIPEKTVFAATITLGRPVGGHGAVRRRPVSELIYDDDWDAPAEWVIDPDGTSFTQAGPPKKK